MIYLARGSLPWQDLRIVDHKARWKQILSMKELMTPKELCEGLPEEFTRYFTHIRSVEFDGMPDYAFLSQMFQSLFKRMDYGHDTIYDWTILLFLISEEKRKSERGEADSEKNYEGYLADISTSKSDVMGES